MQLEQAQELHSPGQQLQLQGDMMIIGGMDEPHERVFEKSWFGSVGLIWLGKNLLWVGYEADFILQFPTSLVHIPDHILRFGTPLLSSLHHG